MARLHKDSCPVLILAIASAILMVQAPSAWGQLTCPTTCVYPSCICCEGNAYYTASTGFNACCGSRGMNMDVQVCCPDVTLT